MPMSEAQSYYLFCMIQTMWVKMSDIVPEIVYLSKIQYFCKIIL